MIFTIYWKHGKTDTVDGYDAEDGLAKAGFDAQAVSRIAHISNGTEKVFSWSKPEKSWVPRTETKQEVIKNNCYQFMVWMFRTLYNDVFLSFEPIAKGEKLQKLSNSEIRRLFENRCIEINGDFFEMTEEVPPIVYSVVLFPKNENKRNTIWKGGWL